MSPILSASTLGQRANPTLLKFSHDLWCAAATLFRLKPGPRRSPACESSCGRRPSLRQLWTLLRCSATAWQDAAMSRIIRRLEGCARRIPALLFGGSVDALKRSEFVDRSWRSWLKPRKVLKVLARPPSFQTSAPSRNGAGGRTKVFIELATSGRTPGLGLYGLLVFLFGCSTALRAPVVSWDDQLQATASGYLQAAVFCGELPS